MTKRHNENMQRTSLLIMCLFVAGHTQGTCPQFSLSYPPNGTYLCPGSNITYTCVLNSSVISVITIWKGSAFKCPANTGQISLTQKSIGVPDPTASGSCGGLSAVTTNISTDGTCFTSVLTIPAVQALNGTNVTCADGDTGAVVGSDTLKITTSPGPVGTLTLINPSVYQLRVAWAPPTTGGVPTSYSVSINDSSNTTFTVPANGTLQKTFTGLTRDTLYTVSVVAINCAGTSNVTSANRRTCSEASPGPVGSIAVTNTSVDQLTVAWAPPTTGGVPTSYSVSINDSSSGPFMVMHNGSSLYTHTFTGLTSDTLYTVSVVAINCAGTSNVTSQRNKTRPGPSVQQNDGMASTGAIIGGCALGLVVFIGIIIAAIVLMNKYKCWDKIRKQCTRTCNVVCAEGVGDGDGGDVGVGVAADGDDGDEDGDEGDGDDGDGGLHNTSDSTSPTTTTIRRRQLTNNPNTVQ